MSSMNIPASSQWSISDVLKRLEVGFEAQFDTTPRRRAINEHLRDVLSANKGKSVRSRLQPHPLAEQRTERSRADRIPVDVVLEPVLGVAASLGKRGPVQLTAPR